MDDKEIKIDSGKSPFRAAYNIDKTLEQAYKAPKLPEFSKNEDEATIQKAVLYHKIRMDKDLREGKQSPENDARYNKLAEEAISGSDPVVQHIKSRKPEQQAQLLGELMRSDKEVAWFEDLVKKADEKKKSAEEKKTAAEPEKKKNLIQQVEAERDKAQAALLEKIAGNPDADPKAFLAQPENYAAIRRILAAELHAKQLEHENREFEEAIQYEDAEAQRQLRRKKEAFAFEKEAGGDLERHFENLESTAEVTTEIYKLAQCKSMKELAEAVKNPPVPQRLRRYDNLKLMEEKMIPGAVNSFLEDKEISEKDPSLYKALKDLTENQKKKLPDPPTPEDCEKRMKAYDDVLKKLDKSEYGATEEGQKLKETLQGQKERLHDTALAPERNKINIKLKADTLIDYIDTSDPSRKPMDALEAREKLIRGAELEQITFGDDDFVGTSRKVTYDKKTGLINKGPEKLITRAKDLSEKNSRKPELQIEDLRKIKEVLKQSDPFYVKNSESYNKVTESLNKVIKAQASLDKDANVRQVEELRNLYAELDSNAAKYVKEKAERMKTGDDRAQMRLDAIKTLQSITGAKHVGKVTLQLYDEEAKLEKQQKMAEPCNKIMNKWKKNGAPKTPSELQEFKKDFEAMSDRMEMLGQNYEDLTYFQANIAEGVADFSQKAEDVQKQLDPGEKLDSKKLQNMKDYALDCDESMKKIFAMDGRIDTKKKEKTKEQPEKKKEKGGPVK